MQIEKISIPGVWVGTPRTFSDERGLFFEWFQQPNFTLETGSNFNLMQANCSISNRGVIRGIHFAKFPPGQAKYVTCFSGEVFDVLVDLRPNSPTFGKWESVLINSDEPKVVYIPNGIGHAFMALSNQAVFVYLCDQTYNPENEFEINPLDKNLAISWPNIPEIKLSPKDKNAPSFKEISKKIINNSL